MTNEALCEAIQAGDQNAAAELVRRNEGLARRAVGQYNSPGVEREDLLQVARIAITQAAMAFDPARGTRFSSYYVAYCKGKLRRAVRTGRMIAVPDYLDARDYPDALCVLDEPAFDEDSQPCMQSELVADDRPGPEAQALAKCGGGVGDLLRLLPRGERQALRLTMGFATGSPLTLRAAGAILGISAAGVAARERRALARLRNLMTSDD